MPLARIIASNPAKARETAQSLRQSGYAVEIVHPDWRSDSPADLEYNLDTNTMITEPADNYVPGEREFFLGPLWRNLTAGFLSRRDVARAQKLAIARRAVARTNLEPTVQPSARKPIIDPELVQQQQLEQARQLELRRREHDEQLHRKQIAEEREVARQKQEEIRQQRMQQEREAALREQEVLRNQRIEQERQDALRQQEALRLRRERDEALQREHALQLQKEVLLRQDELRRQQAVLRQQEEEARQQEAIRQHQVLRQQEEERRQRAVRRQQEELRHFEALKLQQEAEMRREQEAAEREKTLREHPADGPTLVAPVSARHTQPEGASLTAAPVLGLRDYLSQRWNYWRTAHALRGGSRETDSNSFAWRQAWPIAAGVAAAFLLGWGAASYSDATPVAHATQPAIAQAPVKYAPYPVQHLRTVAPRQEITHKRVAATRIARRQPRIVDEVIVHKYPAQTTTAQNKPLPRKRISDLQ